jgi:hypothetical protein
MLQSNWRQVLSWAETGNLTGWLVEIIHKKSKDTSYGVILESSNTFLKAIWRDNEESAINSWVNHLFSNPGMYIDTINYTIIPLRKVEI